MLPALLLTAIASLIPRAVPVQTQPVLHIKVVLVDAEGKTVPVPRHALLISENPASAAPRRVVTALDGTVDVRVRPGNYTVESDKPVALNGKAYQWTQIVDVPAGREPTLELTASNADVEAATAATPGIDAAMEADPSFLLPRWQDSVVAIWTPKTHASGVLIDQRGLIATSQRVIGSATTVEVQLTPEIKVAGSVLASDADKDVSILRIDPAVAASVRALPLACADAAKLAVADGQELYAIGAPLREPKRMDSGRVTRIAPHSIEADLRLAIGSAGGPVLTAAGAAVGITSLVDASDDGRRGDVRVVPVADACEVVTIADQKFAVSTAPSGTHLPVEPVRPFPPAALKEVATKRAGSLNPYQISSEDFDVAFITPVLTYGAKYQEEQASRRERGSSGRMAPLPQPSTRTVLDFGYWSEYLEDFPPVLLVRVTPRFVEGFWTTVARGAARTQGVALPPIKRFKSGFLRMRAFCGDAEITPIHPFKLEQRISDSEAINEGLYVFDPGAFGPHCATVKLVLSSEKDPDKMDTKVVDPRIIDQIWQDFAPYRDRK
jgi:S1-C subfamily serine protease